MLIRPIPAFSWARGIVHYQWAGQCIGREQCLKHMLGGQSPGMLNSAIRAGWQLLFVHAMSVYLLSLCGWCVCGKKARCASGGLARTLQSASAPHRRTDDKDRNARIVVTHDACYAMRLALWIGGPEASEPVYLG